MTAKEQHSHHKDPTQNAKQWKHLSWWTAHCQGTSRLLPAFLRTLFSAPLFIGTLLAGVLVLDALAAWTISETSTVTGWKSSWVVSPRRAKKTEPTTTTTTYSYTIVFIILRTLHDALSYLVEVNNCLECPPLHSASVISRLYFRAATQMIDHSSSIIRSYPSKFIRSLSHPVTSFQPFLQELRLEPIWQSWKFHQCWRHWFPTHHDYSNFITCEKPALAEWWQWYHYLTCHRPVTVIDFHALFVCLRLCLQERQVKKRSYVTKPLVTLVLNLGYSNQWYYNDGMVPHTLD